MTGRIVEVDKLCVEYRDRGGAVRALNGASITLSEGEVVGVVGESGSGKTTLALALGRLLPVSATRVAGDVVIAGHSIYSASDSELRKLRQSLIGFILQSPISTFDPTQRIGRQFCRCVHVSETEAGEMLRAVGLGNPHRVLASYPHQLSGGMAQRVAIAIAMGRKPKFLCADEPTASVDRTVQETVMELLVEMSRAEGTTLSIFTHDLRVVAKYCDRVAVMYGGRVVEVAPCRELFASPKHPYTRGLLQATVGHETPGAMLHSIPGSPPVLRDTDVACSFAPRCSCAESLCAKSSPELRTVAGHEVACFQYYEAGNVATSV